MLIKSIMHVSELGVITGTIEDPVPIGIVASIVAVWTYRFVASIREFTVVEGVELCFSSVVSYE